MLKFPQLNRHMIAIPTLALAIIGVAVAGNTLFQRPARTLSEIGVAQSNQSWANPATQQWANPAVTSNFLAELSKVPPNAYGSAQPEAAVPQSQKSAIEPPLKPTENTLPSEAKNWTKEEWRLASAAVMAYRKAGKLAKSLSPSASSDVVWQPPEEIANMEAKRSR